MASDGTFFGSRSPPHSETTLQDAKHRRNTKKVQNLTLRIGNVVFTVLVLERSLVAAGFGQLLTGIVVYTGTIALRMDSVPRSNHISLNVSQAVAGKII
jgi:hypothetical protein